MADIDALFAGTEENKEDRIEIDGMCDAWIDDSPCYYPFDYGVFNRSEKKMDVYCVKGHKVTIDWVVENG